MLIQNTLFTNGFASYGGVLFSQGDNNIQIIGSKFQENTVSKQGGAIYADSYLSLVITDGCTFLNNKALKGGGDALYLTNAVAGDTKIKNAKFSSNQESNFVFIEDSYQLTIESVSVSHTAVFKKTQSKTAGVHLRNIPNFNIINSQLRNLYGTYQSGGGALIVEETDFTARQTGINTITNTIIDGSFA